ncbi:amidophosphoribosyltransferase [Bacillus benzoevorans]|uniref:Amidophosphoribosyltransferase n=1 Tax=Bacillus benzoevorans TaxID=1456 RepID=A0A7X0HPB3_9BACI|nr:amidophosphoribosyltransferase [Bacillus benzoevorans]
MFGVWGISDAARLCYFGLHSLQHRGQEGAGIVVSQDGNLKGHHGLGLLTEVFKEERQIERLKGEAAIGHVLYSMDGSSGMRNIQPFIFKFHDEELALAHSGNLTNGATLRRELENEGAIFSSTSDTEILMHLIRRSKKDTLIERVKESLNKVKGAFDYLILTPNELIGALDPNGFRPLSLGQLSNGAYILASETCAFDVIGAKFIHSIKPGEMVVVNNERYQIEKYTEDTTVSIDSMEYIYFARPDSNIAGVNVHTARKNMGRTLAKEAPAAVDVVIGVPNSSLSAASGYAEQSGIPNEMGLVKNQYIARTFIQPTQALRELGVRMKLSAVSGVVNGKKVVVVDDSIVRGTTSKHIVQLLRDAGAVEVHMRIASPLFCFPDFYGIDVQDSKQLIAADHSVEEIREIIGADSLAFLSVNGTIDSIGLNFDAPYKGLCMSYFTGEYPTPLYDYEADYVKSLEKQTHLK